jgi:hypothetical protein
MPSHVDQRIQDMRDKPTEGQSVSVLLGVSGEKDIVADQVSELGGTVDADLPYGTLRVTVPETTLSRICSIESLQSIEARYQVQPQ